MVPDPNIISNGRINVLEGDILFSGTNYDPDIRFMHNDFTESNCIVDNARSWDLFTGKWLDFLAGRLPEKSTGASEHHSESISWMPTWGRNTSRIWCSGVTYMMMVCQKIEWEGSLIRKEHFCAVVCISLEFQFRARILSCSTMRGVNAVSARMHNWEKKTSNEGGSSFRYEVYVVAATSGQSCVDYGAENSVASLPHYQIA